ncbi:MAG: heavy metal-responsive transcriptional regulator [Vicinamibacterales bacterium]
MVKDDSLTLGAGALSRQTGVSTDTLRHYERKGLLASPPRTSSGYRRYPQDAVVRVRLIQRALIIGFSLDELGRVLKERAAGGAPCRKVRGIVQERLTTLNQQLADLKHLKRDLHAILDEWDARLERTPSGEQAHLLEALAHGPTPRGPKPRGVPRPLSPSVRPSRP